MIDPTPALDDHDLDLAIDCLLESNSYDVHVELWNRQFEVVDDLTPYLAGSGPDAQGSGQWDLDATLDVGRTLALDLFDPTNQIKTAGAAFLQMILVVDWRTYVPALDDTISWPLGGFTVTAADPQGPFLKFNGIGAADLARGNMLTAHTLSKGHLVVEGIKTALHDWAGFPLWALDALPHLDDTHPRDIRTRFGQTPLAVAKSLASSIGYQLFCDGRMRWQMRQLPTSPCFTFDKRSIVGFPTKKETLVDSNYERIPNALRLNGYKGSHGSPPGSGEPAVNVTVYTDQRSPISKESMNVCGVEYPILKIVDSPNTKVPERAKEKATADLLQADQTAVQLTYDSIRLPFLEDRDCVMVEYPGFTTIMNVGQASLGFGPGDSTTMSIGAKKTLSLAGARAQWS